MRVSLRKVRSHLGKLARLTEPAHLHMKAPESVVFEKSSEKVYLFYYKETMFLYLTIALKTVIHLVTVSLRFLIFHEEFYLNKIYHEGPKFNMRGKSDH